MRPTTVGVRILVASAGLTFLAVPTIGQDHGTTNGKTPEPKEVVRTDTSKGCGVYATALYLRRTGMHGITFKTVERAVDSDHDGFSSLADVQQGLRAYGVESVVAQVPSTTPIDRPAIVRLARGPYDMPQSHFVLVEPVNGLAHVRVFLPPAGVGLWTPQQLASQWDGYVIYPGKQPSTRAQLLVMAALALGVTVLVLGAAIAVVRRMQ